MFKKSLLASLLLLLINILVIEALSIVPFGWKIFLIFILIPLLCLNFIAFLVLFIEYRTYGAILGWKLESKKVSFDILNNLYMEIQNKESDLQVLKSLQISFEQNLGVEIHGDEK